MNKHQSQKTMWLTIQIAMTATALVYGVVVLLVNTPAKYRPVHASLPLPSFQIFALAAVALWITSYILMRFSTRTISQSENSAVQSSAGPSVNVLQPKQFISQTMPANMFMEGPALVGMFLGFEKSPLWQSFVLVGMSFIGMVVITIMGIGFWSRVE